MIKHIVCFKLVKPTVELLEQTKELLLSMEGKVPQVLGINVGIDILHSQRSYDIILEVVVQDMKQLDLYQNDPYHCEVIKKHMHAIAENSIAIDYEL